MMQKISITESRSEYNLHKYIQFISYNLSQRENKFKEPDRVFVYCN